MRLTLILSLSLLIWAMPASSDLSLEDFEKIRTLLREDVRVIVREEIAASEKRMRAEIAASEKRTKTEITASERRMREYVSQEIKIVNMTISEMDKRLEQIFGLVIVLVAFIGVVVGIPQIIVATQRKHQRAQDEKIEEQQKQIEAQHEQIEALRQEMEARKIERPVTP